MTITDQYLVGNPEPFSETLRKWFFDLWVNAKTDNVKPKFMSPHGVDGAVADLTKSVSSTDWQAFINQDFIRLKQVGQIPTNDKTGGLGQVRSIYMVHIDIFSESANRQYLFGKHINDIIHDNMPNNQNRINKTDGQTSAIATFDRTHIHWEQIGEFKDVGVVMQLAGELGIVTAQNKS